MEFGEIPRRFATIQEQRNSPFGPSFDVTPNRMVKILSRVSTQYAG
jgi:hypothetical protein